MTHRRVGRAWPAAVVGLALMACAPTGVVSASSSPARSWGDAIVAGTDEACRTAVPGEIGALCANRDLLAPRLADDGTVLTRFGPLSCPNTGGADPCQGVQLPVWATQIVTAVEVDGITVLTPTFGAPALVAALPQARAAALTAPGARADVPVVVEVAQDDATFRRATLGVADDSTGAVTLRRGGTATIVIGPRLRGPGLSTVVGGYLAHELVHAVADTATWQGGRWLAEGWADHIAVAHSPALAEASDRALTGALAAGIPATLPTDAAFDLGHDAEASYALARRAVDVLVARVGEQRAREVSLQWARGEQGAVTREDLTVWWREDLAARR